MYRKTKFGPRAVQLEKNADGTYLLRQKQPLQVYPRTIIQRLYQWADQKPHHIFLAQRGANGNWEQISYSQTLVKVKSIAKYLIEKNLHEDRTLVILSGNSLEHALLALASMHAGIPYTPLSPAYSLVSEDLGKLKHCLNLMTPKLVFAQDGAIYSRALQMAKSMFKDVEIVTVSNHPETDFAKLLNARANAGVDHAYQQVNEDSIAKILFTSGSTDLPKGVINTQGMWCANLQQITQAFPFMEEEPPVFVDWLPWNHTFGGNHNFGMTLYHGGTLYIDDGKPLAEEMEKTVRNLQKISTTSYFNVPKGFDMLIPFLRDDANLRNTFFKNLEMLFYAGASMAQPIWDGLEELAIMTVGEKIPIITGLGCTEAGPSAMFANWTGGYSGLLGVPVAGLDVKLVPDGDKMEARYRAPNITPGYWRNEVLTKKGFDEQGFYRSGDAVKFVDEEHPEKGLLFDGRIAEDFKLSTGTWVNVGMLRAKVMDLCAPIVRGVAITGLDRDYVGAILFLNPEACSKLVSVKSDVSVQEVFFCPEVRSFIDLKIEELNKLSTGSANRIAKTIIAVRPLSIDLGEITDKGSLNQRAILKHRSELIEKLYEID